MRAALVRRVAVFPAVVLAAGLLSALPSATGTAAEPASTACPTRPAPPSMPKLTSTRVFGPGLGLTMAHDGDSVVLQGSTLVRVGPQGERGRTTLTPAPLANTSSGALDESGATYLLRYPYAVDKYGADGRLVWSRTVPEPLGAVYVIGTGVQQRVGAVYRDRRASTTWDLQGAATGPSAVFGNSFAPVAGGGVAGLDSGRYVRVFDASGTETMAVGDRNRDNDPSPAGAPLHFYQLGGVAQLPDGGYLVTDTSRGIMVLTREGLIRGELPPDSVDALGLTQASSIVVRGDDVLVAAGHRWTSNQYLVRLSLEDLLARATHGEAKDPRLGLGAGLTVAQQGAFVPAGQPVDVRLRLDPWWQRVATTTAVCWTLRDQDQLRAGATGSATTVPLSGLTFGGEGTSLPLPAAGDPGAYRLDATLVRDGAAVSTTQLVFTVGAPEHRLDLSALPPGAGYGGPAPARGVALADVLGTGLHRGDVSWATLLRNGPDAPLDFSAYDAPFASAAKEAAARGTVFEVQVADGSPAEKALVANGTWERRVEELVTHFRGTVRVWEAWNEPNNTFGSAPDYVAKVLKPFHRAVKRADPSATTVGGSTVGVSLPWWSALIAAGGLDAMDVAGVHPYTGHNRSLEEEGALDQLRQLKAALVRADGTRVPLWDTEHSWWSNGPYNFLAQADLSARKLLWNRALGIERWYYFLPEGGWGNDGVSFSALEHASYVKPAALALMTTSAQLRGRPFLGEVDLGMPSAFALRFGPRTGDAASGELLVAWTDGLRLPAVLSADQPGRGVRRTELLGAAEDIVVDAPVPAVLSSAPTFFGLTGPGRLTVTSSEAFGEDLALASKGATATASSTRHRSASGVIDGNSGVGGSGGDLPGLAVWASAAGDRTRTLDVRLGAPSTVNRVVVATHSIGSVVPGLRDYDVQVRSAPTAAWSTVGRVRGQFGERQALVTFPAQTVSHVRVQVLAVNHSGYLDGGQPPTWWWAEDGAPYGPAVINEVLVFGPGTSALPPAPAQPSDSPSATSPAPPAVQPAPPVPAAPAAPAAPTAPAPPAPAPAPPLPTVPVPATVSPISTAPALPAAAPTPAKAAPKPSTPPARPSAGASPVHSVVAKATATAATLSARAAKSRRTATALTAQAKAAAQKAAVLPAGRRKTAAVAAARALDRRARAATTAAVREERAAAQALRTARTLQAQSRAR